MAFNDDQPRDETGKWTSGGAGGLAKKLFETKARAFRGEASKKLSRAGYVERADPENFNGLTMPRIERAASDAREREDRRRAEIGVADRKVTEYTNAVRAAQLGKGALFAGGQESMPFERDRAFIEQNVRAAVTNFNMPSVEMLKGSFQPSVGKVSVQRVEAGASSLHVQLMTENNGRVDINVQGGDHGTMTVYTHTPDSIVNGENAEMKTMQHEAPLLYGAITVAKDMGLSRVQVTTNAGNVASLAESGFRFPDVATRDAVLTEFAAAPARPELGESRRNAIEERAGVGGIREFEALARAYVGDEERQTYIGRDFLTTDLLHDFPVVLPIDAGVAQTLAAFRQPSALGAITPTRDWNIDEGRSLREEQDAARERQGIGLDEHDFKEAWSAHDLKPIAGGDLPTSISPKYVSVTDDGGGEVKVEATLYDSKGRRAGQVERDFMRDSSGKLYVYHAFLEMEPAYRGTGYAQTLFRQSIPLYEKAGAKYVEVHTGLTDGAWKWAYFGYKWDRRETGMKTAEFKNWLIDHKGFRESTAAKIAERHCKDPWDLVHLKIKGDPIGKTFLKGRNWEGKLSLDPTSKGYRQMAHYVQLSYPVKGPDGKTRMSKPRVPRYAKTKQSRTGQDEGGIKK